MDYLDYLWTLERANNYERQIKELNRFTSNCKNYWHIFRLNHPKFKLKTKYGSISNEIGVSQELENRILKTIEDYVSMLEDELDKMREQKGEYEKRR